LRASAAFSSARQMDPYRRQLRASVLILSPGFGAISCHPAVLRLRPPSPEVLS
jgi:hypothetical protein